MVISFSGGNNKQRYLIFVFIAVVLVTFFILKQNSSEPSVPQNIAEETYSLNKKKIDVNFEVLNSSVLQNLSSFEELQVYPEAKGVSLSPSFSWIAVPGADNYIFEIIGAFSTTTKSTSFNLLDIGQKLQSSKDYIWRVKSCNADQSDCSAWNSRSFTVLSLFDSPKLTQPAISEVPLGRDNPFMAY